MRKDAICGRACGRPWLWAARLLAAAAALLVSAGMGRAQAGPTGLVAADLPAAPALAPEPPQASSTPQAGVPAQAGAPVRLTLAQAIALAERNEPNYALARARQKVAGLEPGIARAGLLPGVVYANQLLYTQPNGLHGNSGQVISAPPVVFEANNSVHEYISQASITETAGLRGVAALRLAKASAARATAELEIARRGLVAATVSLFFNVGAAERRVLVLEAAQAEAANFVALTGKREQAREAAHADVLKASLTLEQRERDVTEAELALDRARLELGVVLFADPLTPYTLEAPAGGLGAVPTLEAVRAEAARHNPELAAAQAVLRESDAQVLTAQAAYLPDVALNFSYGIDAPQFARRGRSTPETLGQQPQNLGYSIAATLNIPVWDWLATPHRVQQSEAQREAVRAGLTATQKRLLVNLSELYAEARTAQAEQGSLGQTVGDAEQSLRLTRLRYSAGEATVLEVVDAENVLYLARLAQSDGMLRLEQALGSLQTLTGTL